MNYKICFQLREIISVFSRKKAEQKNTLKLQDKKANKPTYLINCFKD